jgi:antibiotic biosynthesis monooxygenase (ABM) superfamily enzyme
MELLYPLPAPGSAAKTGGSVTALVNRMVPRAGEEAFTAVLLLLVVYPMSLAISTWGGPVLDSLPVLAGTFITSVVMVWLMTYVLVPILTKVFQFWLQPERLSKN